MTAPLRIVVADDEPDMREYFQKVLPLYGYQVVAAAENGDELVRLCRQHRPDVVITDVKMPGMDGIEAASVINQDCAAPVILVSAYSDHDTIERAKADHVMCYLVKPIKQVDLAPSIELAVKRFRQMQSQKKGQEEIMSDDAKGDEKEDLA